MKEIKTILEPLHGNIGKFDASVNAALREGFYIVRRYVTAGFKGDSREIYPCMVTELERDAVTEDEE